MLSFFTNLLVLWEQSKQRALKKQRETTSRFKQGVDTKLSVLNNVVKPEEDKKLNASKMKIRILTALSTFLGFFETLPVFFSAMYILILLFCAVGVMIIIIMLTSLISNLFEDIAKGFIPPSIDAMANGASKGKAQWTEEELGIRGKNLTDFEKNLYRIVMLSKKALNGYGDVKFVSNYDESAEIALPYAVGISSIETSMRFYEGGKQLDITKIPSDLATNDSGYGFLGLSSSATVDYYVQNLAPVGVKGEVASNIKNTYVPDSPPSYDARFAPWGTAMSAMHLYGDMIGDISTDATEKKMDIAMNAFGITTNTNKVKAHLHYLLSQAEYHGAVSSEYQGYLNFWCALYALTSDKDEERSFDKWGIVVPEDDYTESTARKLVLGKTIHFGIDAYADPTSLPKATVDAYFTLNGEAIDMPLWAYVYTKYSGKQEIKEAWSQAVEFSRYEDRTHDRVLNFHYGFNSYLQGIRIMKDISSKLTGTAYVESKGFGQGTWDNKTIADFVASAEDSKFKEKALSFQEKWGTAVNIEAKKINGTDWEPDEWGVPFYQQGGGAESYGGTIWSLGKSTFDYSACMIYAYAYVASALTGNLINPPEMGSAMYVTGSLVQGGVSPKYVPTTFTKLGLKCTTETLSDGYGLKPTGAKFDEVWAKIDATLDAGGLAVVMGQNPWTSGDNHFFVITSKKIENGNNMYKIYTSVSAEQTMIWYGKEKFRGTLQSTVYLITK